MSNNLYVLGSVDSVANHFLSELRDASVQRDRMRFRRNMERLGEVLAYELSKELSYEAVEINTPLGRSQVKQLITQPVLVTILRAGVPFHQGFLNYFDSADCGFIGAYRNESGEGITVNMEYTSLPSIDKKPVILIDPMLATGQSLRDAHRMLLSKGTPSHLHIVSIVAAPEGIAFLKEELKVPYSLWTCAVDKELNSSFYIVPGLGDAGDLSYGAKQ